MVDSEEVLKELDPPDDVEIIGIVVNERGADRAIASDAISTLGFPYSVSPTFLKNNQNQTLEEALDQFEAVKKKADDAGLDIVVYISMAFGNPYGDDWSIEEVVEAVNLLESEDVHMISLADTVGLATPDQIRDLLGSLLAKYNYLEIGAHLHSRRESAAEKVLAAYEAGCRRFDSALGGLGGCPFAQDALVGNIPTEIVLHVLQEKGADVAPLKRLDGLLRVTDGISAKYSGAAAD